MDDLATFREEAARWLEDNCPASMRTPPSGDDDDVWGGRRATFPSEDAKLWMQRAAAKGWTVPTWPKQYGGGGLSKAEAKLLASEMKRLGCRTPLKSFGIWMLGPVLLEYGSEEQKLEHLPKIARGEIRWCQGYSEPSAGSDLASLQMRAELRGEEYVVNGSKIWTSHADKADWIFCLVRTDPSAKKREGIGFLLIDMRTPGISVRPITLISGYSPFCETFMDDVHVPAKNLVGAPNEGWTIAKRLLEHERETISLLRDAHSSEEEPLEVAARRYFGGDGPLTDAVLRDRITQANMDFVCNKLTLRRSAEAAQAGRGSGPETSMFKLYATELNKRRRELYVRVAGFSGIGWSGPGFSAAELQRTRDWLRSRANSIEGGTSEVQLNIIAKRVLGLPD